ncbi:DUF429 domain-containing protein [Natronomonas gomsonensis]|uniref:DUF429 domain-containing protein n=1 Tax=Natronomonas gomsonensis TaxID=1046043 RepID=UPI0015BADC59|nr:DUF429 domain-containing protein [Natronomonas gomsonensis]
MEIRGVDFSGASEPGDDIWITEGSWDGDRLTVRRCRSATEVFGATGRTTVLNRLREYLASEPGTSGLDVSFGLPDTLLPDCETWRETLEWFEAAFAAASADEMREELKRRARASDADGVELKRRTDDAVGANSPYSFITYYQTLYGIREVVAPLVADGRVAVPPMQPADERNLIEIYPAGTLRRLDTVDETYKDGAADARRRRKTILNALVESTPLELADGIRERAVSETGGDALDSIVAAVATARAVRRDFDPDGDFDEREGCIFV